MKPYTAESEIAEIARKLPEYIKGDGMEIRVLMPRYGSINERRHRLHEVVRLSGMNIIVNDDDFPLIIKVASLPGAKMQVYFLDNEDFFKRKNMFADDKGKPFKDNAERMVFFCKGVIETVKKFGWPPDVIHCHGWMTSLVPLYIKTAYNNEALFKNSKVVYSIYEDKLNHSFGEQFIPNASINNLSEGDLKDYQNGEGVTLHKGAMAHADALITASPNLSESVDKALAQLEKPVLSYQEGDEGIKNYIDFYHSLFAEVEQ